MGGGGGGKGGGGRRAARIAAASQQQLLGLAQQFEQESRPVRGELLGQALEALRTGGVGARIPIITAAQEQSRFATSRALQQTGEQLTRTGLTGTPFGERIMAELGLAGEMETAGIPAREAARVIETFPVLASPLAQAPTQAAGAAAATSSQMASTLGAAQIGAKAQMTSAIFGAGGRIGAGFAGRPKG